MMRAIVEFVVMMLAFAVLRAVISAISKGTSGGSARSAQAPSAGPRSAPKTDLKSGSELRRDPVCGTYVAVDSSLHRNYGGLTEYFCSQKCLDRYKAA